VTRLILATCVELPDGDEDSEILHTALARCGIAARWQVWDDPEATWDDPVVIRSPWDYTRDRDRFMAWCRQVPRLINPLDVIEWSSDKVYLSELTIAGLPTVPTRVFPPGTSPEFPEPDQASEFVVKPSVGAGSRGAGRFGAGEVEQATDHVAQLHRAGRTALVQPYLDAVDSVGETALLYFDGTFSHAIAKGAMLPQGTVHPVISPAKGAVNERGEAEELFVAERISARTPTTAEHAVGEAAMTFIRAQFCSDLLYARVDLLPTTGGPVIGELELIEPSLFLGYSEGAADRFAKAVAAAVG
jgi:hypothetical protein